jgi:hypothetical protein
MFENTIRKIITEQTARKVESSITPSVNEICTFINKRAGGAKKIQNAAASKGGVATLTAIHFKAKEVPYKNCQKHCEDGNIEYIKEKADECFDKLKSWDKMSQREFQHVMGQLEAYGEVYIRQSEEV